MTSSIPAVTPTAAEAQTIIDRAIDRNIAARHAKVAAFIDDNYSLLGVGLGALTPVFMVAANPNWGFAAAWLLRTTGRA